MKWRICMYTSINHNESDNNKQRGFINKRYDCCCNRFIQSVLWQFNWLYPRALCHFQCETMLFVVVIN